MTKAPTRPFGPGGDPLPAAFFGRPADRVARDLLGADLVVRGRDGGIRRLSLVEVEAYLGAHDLACHGRTGPTKRNATMFGPAGVWYVYLCYGIHWMLNIVTGDVGQPAAVLVRGVAEIVGPGRVTKGLEIDGGFDGRPATPETGLWIAKPAGGVRWPLPARWIERTPRIGVDYAGLWAAKPLRFVVDAGRLPRMVRAGVDPFGLARPTQPVRRR